MKTIQYTLNFLFLFMFLNASVAQDWPNLERYQKENAALKAPTSKESRVVLMGNPITEGWLQSRPDFFANKNYINRGIGGQTTPQILLRFRQDVVNLKPAVVVILAGINDIAGNTGPSTIEMIADNIISMAEIAKANNIKVIFCSVLPANEFHWRKGLEPAEKVIKLNTLLKTYAEQHKIGYLDYFSSMVDESKGLKKELGKDGVHPNVDGYKIMEPMLEAAIKKALK